MQDQFDSEQKGSTRRDTNNNTPHSANRTPNININPLLETEKLVGDHDSEYVDFEQESFIEETIPAISVRAVLDGGERYNNGSTANLLHIRVRPNCLSKESLGRSIVQGLAAKTGTAVEYHNLSGESPIEGMFRENDSLFVPLDDILYSPLEYNDCVFRLSPPKPPVEKKAQQGTSFSLFAIVALMTFFFSNSSYVLFCGECIWDSLFKIWSVIIFAPIWFDTLFVEWPLQQVYRNGPSLLGWEGARLSSICARITYYGDESFWMNNMDECKRTYERKVAASMIIRKPIVYLLLFFGICYIFKSLHKLRSKVKPDPDMEETYKAIHVIVKQLKKAVGKT